MYKLTESINKVIEDCKAVGNGRIELWDNKETVIYAEWEAWKINHDYDVITLYVYEFGVCKFNYQIEETKILTNR
jgi:hypothetical protein